MESLSQLNQANCIKCMNPFLDNQDSICCDECDGWLHLSCSQLTFKQFSTLSSTDNPFYCPACCLKMECPTCSKICKVGQSSIFCNSCEHWVHEKCSAVTPSDFLKFSNSDLIFNCCNCLFPFTNTSALEFKLLFNENFSQQSSELLNNNNISHLNSNSPFNNNEILTSHFQYITPSTSKTLFQNDNDFSLLSLNIRSLNRNFSKLEVLVSEIGFMPDVILVSETWITESSVFIHKLEGYSFINKPCETGQIGGAGIFIKDKLNFDILHSTSLDAPKCEDIWIKIKFSPNKTLVIGSIYRHPNYHHNEFQDKLSSIIYSLSSSNQSFITGGDININLLSDKESINSYKEEIYSNGCLQTVSSPTRVVENTRSSILDHIYSNLPESKIRTETILYDISDHLPNLTVTNYFHTPKFKQERHRIRDYRKFDFDNFIIDLELALSQIELDDSPADDSWNCFEHIFSTTLNNHAPFRMQSRKEAKHQLKPYITKAIRKSIKTKQVLQKNLSKIKFHFQFLNNIEISYGE